MHGEVLSSFEGRKMTHTQSFTILNIESSRKKFSCLKHIALKLAAHNNDLFQQNKRVFDFFFEFKLTKRTHLFMYSLIY